MKNLIERARDGDWDAVCEIVNALRTRIERMGVYYAMRCGVDANDLIQEAWLALLEALPEVNTSIGDPNQFLLKHAKWRMLDFVKWSRRREHEALDDSMEMGGESIEEEALASAQYAQFVGQLRSSHRELVRLLCAGDTWREAAAKLGCTSANVAYHVRQIRHAYSRWSEDSNGEGESHGQRRGEFLIQPASEGEVIHPKRV